MHGLHFPASGLPVACLFIPFSTSNAAIVGVLHDTADHAVAAAVVWDAVSCASFAALYGECTAGLTHQP
jgi:hypothetical protein